MDSSNANPIFFLSFSAFGLVCLQRNRGTSSISGCSGNADLLGTGEEDYCVPPSANQLVIVGDDINGVQTPSGVFPLQRCQGDCNNDDGELLTSGHRKSSFVSVSV